MFVTRQSTLQLVADLPHHLAGRAASFHVRPANPAYRAALGGFARVSDALGVKLVHATRYLAHLYAVVHIFQANLAVIVRAELA